MYQLGIETRAGCAPATSARPSGAGRLKLTSRPPPAAAPALRKVRRDRVRTAVEINSAGGFVLPAMPPRTGRINDTVLNTEGVFRFTSSTVLFVRRTSPVPSAFIP